MISLSLKERKLLIYSIVINIISILVNIRAQVGPAPDCYQYTDDPCTTTCIGCTYTRATNTFREWCCCRPDWGCWLNPFEYNHQVSRCIRRVMYCIVQIPGTDPPQYHSYPCCLEPKGTDATGYCDEVNGAPCCSPGFTTGACY